MEDYLQRAVKIILTSFQDSHPRVCWAAFHFMQLPTDLVGTIQILHHSSIVPALVAAVDKEQNPRVEVCKLWKSIDYVHCHCFSFIV